MTEKITTGRRIYPDVEGKIILQSGDYVKDTKGGYFVIKTPNGLVAGIQKHTVVEHEDGTISVSPSILVNYPEGDKMMTWHGFLEKGVFREV